MTVRELIEINAKIVDVCIEVRKDGKLLDYLAIGLNEGVKPRYPMQVPRSIEYIDNMSIATKKDGTYIDKSINAWDDGKDYWEIKIKRIPQKWLDLEVYSWSVSQAHRWNSRINRNSAECIRMWCLPSGESLEVKQDKPTPKDKDNDGQLSLFDLIGGEQE